MVISILATLSYVLKARGGGKAGDGADGSAFNLTCGCSLGPQMAGCQSMSAECRE